MKTPLEDILKAIIDDAIKSQLKELIDKIDLLLNENRNEKLLSPSETRDFLKINNSTLWRWTNTGKIKMYGIGGKRYYKYSEIIEALEQLKVYY